MNMGSIELQAVEKWFGDVQVIKGVDLAINDGEFIIFVGPSGCGKSTLLRMIAGLEETSRGKVLIDARDATAEPPAKRGLAMVFQSYALYPHMSVHDNMGFSLKAAGASKAEIEEKVGEAARVLKLEPFLDRRPKDLSGGQRQRVAIGRSIVRDPTAFLFDEPLSNLDASLRVEMRYEIAKLHQTLKSTMIYVTHDQVEAMTLADRMIVMNGGVADQIGAPLEVYKNPKTAFVAGFIGSPATNFLTATDLAGVVEVGDGTLGIRPEHLQLCPAGEGSLNVDVLYTEALGAETLIHAKLANGAPITVRQDGQMELPESGANLDVRWQADAVMLFDKNGQRVANA